MVEFRSSFWGSISAIDQKKSAPTSPMVQVAKRLKCAATSFTQSEAKIINCNACRWGSQDKVRLRTCASKR